MDSEKDNKLIKWLRILRCKKSQAHKEKDKIFNTMNLHLVDQIDNKSPNGMKKIGVAEPNNENT